MELVATDPTRVGPYRLLRRLGSGGMGVVYLGDTETGGLVAVKSLPLGVGPDVRDRLHREATYLSQVRHPRVAAFVGADTAADRPWIAMQYVAGPSLAQASVPLGPAQLRHLAEGLADALAALHRQGLTHRDVKPGNVILTHDGPVLVDLGIAHGHGLSALTAVGMVVGTPEWMAPEQLSGSDSSPAIDVWGWAAVLAYAATGRAPFGGGPMAALADRIRHGSPDLGGVPGWLQAAVVAGLAKDARVRPSAAQLAGVDGIRRVGAVTTAPPAPRGTPAATRVEQAPPHQAAPHQSAPPAPVWPAPSAADGPTPAPRQPAPRQPAPRQPAPRQGAPLRQAWPPATAWPAQPSVREAARARKQRKAPSPPNQPKAPQTSRPRKRRGFLARMLRRVVLLAILVVVAVVLASAVYSTIRMQLDHIGWLQAFNDFRDQVSRFLGG